jgi:protein subunit release factor A
LYIDDIHVWKEDPAAISEIANSISVNVFPNPTSGLITIETNDLIEEIVLMSANGQMITRTTEKTVDLTNLPSGVYFLNIETDNGVITKKILKH